MGNIGDMALGAGLGMLTDEWARKRQLEYNKKMLGMNVGASKELGRFNQDLAYEMWEKTNYGAQRRELQNAGLNVGLMYKGAGQGGTTSGGSAPSAGGGGMGLINSAPQTAMMKAQIENIKADTEVKKVDAAKRGGVDTDEAKQRIAESGARMGEIAARVKNAETQNDIMSWEKQIKEIEANYEKQSAEADIAQTKAATDKLAADTKNALLENQIDSATAKDVIKQAGIQSVTMVLQNDLLRQKIIGEAANTTETYRKIEKIAAEIVRMEAQTKQGQQGLEQEAQRIILDKIRTEFNAGEEANWIRWINTGANAAGEIMGMITKRGMLKNQTRDAATREWNAHKND